MRNCPQTIDGGSSSADGSPALYGTLPLLVYPCELPDGSPYQFKQQLSILRKEADFASLLIQFNEIKLELIFTISPFSLYLNALHLLRFQMTE